MTSADGVFQQALSKMLIEIFDGPPGQEAYVLNPGDQGLLRQLDSIDAKTASSHGVPGKPSVAAHVDHLHVGLAALNRWAAGEPNPWAGVDWNASWKRNTVSDDEWKALRDDLKRDVSRWRQAVAARATWDGMAASAALSTAAHTAYHLGAIRQILAALRQS